jgi:hypothetical protein
MNASRLPICAILMLIAVSVFAGGEGEGLEFPLPEGYSSASGDGIVLQWKVDGENLQVRLAAVTGGWIAVGFHPTRRMEDSNIIIGYVKDGQVFMSDHYGTGQTTHTADEELGGTNDITEPQGGEENGGTWLSFTIPLDSGDRYDRVLRPGNSYRVNLAAGQEDDFGTYHGTNRTAVTIEL